jgi:hypothetical protein
MNIATVISAVVLVLIAQTAMAQKEQPAPKYSANVPQSIRTPDTVKSRIGELKFTDGIPDSATVQKVYDNLDFSRGVEAFFVGMPAASVYALCEGLDKVGVKKNKIIGVTEQLMDAKALFLTANTTTVYSFLCVDLKNEPMVVQIPPQVLGPIDDAYFRFVTDVGITGPDKGKGGKYLLVPPGYKGALPKSGYHISKTPTFSNVVFYRAFVKNGDIAATVKQVKEARVYPLSAAKNPPKTQEFLNVSGMQFNTIHSNDFHFYEELNAVVQAEPADAFNPESVGLFASIGIKKGQSFNPDARMKSILSDAMVVANATARSTLFYSRDSRAQIYSDRNWLAGFVGGSYAFENDGERLLDARTRFHYYATGITPAMVVKKPGIGSVYAFAFTDTKKRFFDGAHTYKVTLPGPVPAARFWSFSVYDNQTRSILETDQKLGGLDSTLPSLKANADGSYTVWFGPKAPAGQESNWVQTRPGKGWNVILRLYSPMQAWFDKTWKPGDFERVDDVGLPYASQ